MGKIVRKIGIALALFFAGQSVSYGCYSSTEAAAPDYCAQCAQTYLANGCLPSSSYCCKSTCPTQFTEAHYVCPSPTPSLPPPGSPAGPLPTSTPHITCPSGSKDLPAWNECECLVKGQIYTYAPSGGTCACPANYEVVIVDQATSRAECRPVVGKEFFRNNTAISDNYPVCGTGRAPTNAVGDIVLGASSSVPNSNDQQTGPQGFIYKYATGSSTAPRYLYQGYDHCACTWKDFPTSGTKVSGNGSGTLASGKKRFYPDDFGTISSQTSNADVNYGAVAIAKSETVDGRLGTVYSTGYSKCGCPNVNEEMQAIDSSETYASGVVCAPLVKPGPFRVLMKYIPTIHDASPTNSQVINRASEVIHASGYVIDKIMLPDGTSTQTYERKIWGCMYPMSVDPTSKECVFDAARNACNAGNGTDVAASEVSLNISGPSRNDRFLNAVNKKLACCLNEFGTVGATSVKFDCVQNLIDNYADFDALWSSADSAQQGGQLNALMLTNAQGRGLSGFYTLSGSRCEEFSEFAGTIQPGIVNPALGVGAQMKRAQGRLDPNAFEPKGSNIPLPGSGAGSGSAAYSYILGKMVGMGKSVPSTAADRRRCPVLVRAAMVVECPAPGGSPIASYNGQCSSAKNIKVHIRTEQIWEIAGQPKMRTTDTVVDRHQAGDISIDRIISNKYGNACPPGQVSDPAGGGCHY